MSLRRSARIANASPPITLSSAKSTSDKALKRTIGGDGGPTATSKRSKRGPTKKPAKIKAEHGTTFRVPMLTSTLSRERTSTEADRSPALTPSPSLAGIITTSTSINAGDSGEGAPNPPSRPADPHASNATLLTPDGTRETAYPLHLLDSSPSRPGPDGLSHPRSTTSTLLSQACAHLISVDPRLGALIRKHHCHMFSPSGLAEEIDPFRSLASGIMAQQVSGAAAKSIGKKFVALFSENDHVQSTFPTPAQVVAADIARLRLAGLSQRKAEYIYGLAEKFTTGELSTDMLLRASDEEVMEKLIAVRGLGKWSVEMFACFALKRTDVFSTGDLGVQRGMAAFMGKDVSRLKTKGGGKWKYMSEKDMLEGSEKFRPYRSLFMWYMWRVEDVDVSAMQGGDGSTDADAGIDDGDTCE